MKKTPKEETTMKNVLIGYYSRTGSTEEMAKYLAEGIRISGNNVDFKKISEIKSEKDLDGYDGFIFGCPTYHKDITENFKTFL
jgi:flavodoxin